MSGLIFPSNPIEVVVPIAERLVFRDGFEQLEGSSEELEAIDELNEFLRLAQMLGSYAGLADTAFIVPKDPDNHEKIRIHRFDNNVGFQGEMLGSWVLKVGTEEDEQRIRTVCLVFEEAELKITNRLEGISHPPVRVHSEHNVQIPVFSVTEIEPLKAS